MIERPLRLWDDEASLLTNILSAVEYLMACDSVLLGMLQRQVEEEDDPQASQEIRDQKQSVDEWLSHLHEFLDRQGHPAPHLNGSTSRQWLVRHPPTADSSLAFSRRQHSGKDGPIM